MGKLAWRVMRYEDKLNRMTDEELLAESKRLAKASKQAARWTYVTLALAGLAVVVSSASAIWW